MKYSPSIAWCFLLFASAIQAEPPGVAFIFPAGGQQGTKVEFRVGGFYFHGGAEFTMSGAGVEASRNVEETETIWFDGPMMLQPESQGKEDYPKDHLGTLKIDASSPLGLREWSCRTSQGVTSAMKFVVGDLPEVVEKEIEGAAIPEDVSLPVTINGRIFPREDVDLWKFHVNKGQAIQCEVASRSLGYPLQAVLEVTAPDGRPVAGVRKHKTKAGDPAASFTTEETGEYQISIHDAGYGGAPNFVYRLTITTGPQVMAHFPLGGKRGETIQLELTTDDGKSRSVPVRLDQPEGDSVARRIRGVNVTSGMVTLHVDDLSEVIMPQINPVALPAMLNGCITHAGEANEWPLELEKGQGVLFEVIANALGSRLDSVIAVIDADGKEVAKNDDAADGSVDSRLIFTATKAGRHVLKITDRHASRGGPEFGYRIRVVPVSAADFELTLGTDMVNVTREIEAAQPMKKPAKGTGLLVDLLLLGNITKDVTLEVLGLPTGVTAQNTILGAKQKTTELFFSAPPQTPVQVANITVRGTTEIDGKLVTHEAKVKHVIGEPSRASVRLAVVPGVPFKHHGHYLVVNDQPAGTTMKKHFELERGGFEGPLTVMLADKQGRALQRVTASPIRIPAGATSFDYAVMYPPEVELGHTSRIQLMLVGELHDFDGSRHTISYTNFENDNQMISVVSEGLLHITPSATSFAVESEGVVIVPVKIHRDPKLAKSSVRLELEVPRHIHAAKAMPVEVPAGSNAGALRIELAENSGPLNMPVRLIARCTGSDGAPHMAATDIELAHEVKTTRH